MSVIWGPGLNLNLSWKAEQKFPMEVGHPWKEGSGSVSASRVYCVQLTGWQWTKMRSVFSVSSASTTHLLIKSVHFPSFCKFNMRGQCQRNHKPYMFLKNILVSEFKKWCLPKFSILELQSEHYFSDYALLSISITAATLCGLKSQQSELSRKEEGLKHIRLKPSVNISVNFHKTTFVWFYIYKRASHLRIMSSKRFHHIMKWSEVASPVRLVCTSVNRGAHQNFSIHGILQARILSGNL